MADAPVLGAGSIGVWVQVPSPAPDLRSVIRDELPAVFSLCSSTMSGFFISPPHVGMDCVLFKIPSQKAEDFSYRSIIPSLRKKSRLLRLCPCKHGHDASAALPTFCGLRLPAPGSRFILPFHTCGGQVARRRYFVVRMNSPHRGGAFSSYLYM